MLDDQGRFGRQPFDAAQVGVVIQHAPPRQDLLDGHRPGIQGVVDVLGVTGADPGSQQVEAAVDHLPGGIEVVGVTDGVGRVQVYGQPRPVHRLQNPQVRLRSVQQGPGRHLQCQAGAAGLDLVQDLPHPLDHRLEGLVSEIVGVVAHVGEGRAAGVEGADHGGAADRFQLVGNGQGLGNFLQVRPPFSVVGIQRVDPGGHLGHHDVGGSEGPLDLGKLVPGAGEGFRPTDSPIPLLAALLHVVPGIPGPEVVLDGGPEPHSTLLCRAPSGVRLVA